MLNYIPIIIAFVGGSLGLTGSAWDSTRSGRIKFTKRGWLSLTILFVGLSLSVYSTYKTKRAADYETCQRSLVKKLAYYELSGECQRLATPFIAMYVKQTGTSLDISNPDSLDTLFKNVQVFADVDLYEKPELDMGFEDLDHAAALTRVSKSTPPRFREIIKTYSYYLDGEDIVWTNDASGNAAWFGNLPDNRKTVGVLYYFDSDEDQIENLKQFFPRLQQLWRKVKSGSADRDSTRQGCVP